MFCASCLRRGFYEYVVLYIVGVGVIVACTVQDELSELGFGFVLEGLERHSAGEKSRRNGVFVSSV